MSKLLIPPPRYPMPLPLLPETEQATPYPVEALGQLLGDAVKTIASIVKVPEAMAAQSVLGAAAMAAQAHGDVIRSGQGIPLSLFMLTVAESGDRKSSADGLALKAHRQHQRELLEQYKTKRKEYRDADDAYQKARTRILDKAKASPEAATVELAGLDEPTAPPSPFVLAEEPTLEGLHKSLLRGHPSQGLFSDEGGQFFGGHASRPENMLKSVAGLSKLWDGSPISRIRAADGESDARHGCRLSAHLMIQPIVAADVLSNPVMQGQGFLARFLIAWPTSLAGTRMYQDSDPHADPRLVRYWQRMTTMLTLEPIKDDLGELAPPLLLLDERSMSAWIKQHDSIEKQLGQGGDMEDIKPTAAKAAENLLRIAGVFAVVDHRDRIEADLIERAALLVHWYLNEALRLTQPVKVEPQLRDADRLAKWLIAKQWTSFDGRQLQREGPSFVRKSASRRDALLGILVEHRWLTTSDGKVFNLSPVTLATTATTATSQTGSAPMICDAAATGCDDLQRHRSPSQPVAIRSHALRPQDSRLVADVANVATNPKYRGEI
ncbi:MAG: hypothetical protein COA41_20105 [Sphingopyxis sp.]|nr:MAG: hypothetical protein COA41_20105 [Sphingopyxis sp.]